MKEDRGTGTNNLIEDERETSHHWTKRRIKRITRAPWCSGKGRGEGGVEPFLPEKKCFSSRLLGLGELEPRKESVPNDGSRALLGKKRSKRSGFIS